MKKIDRSQKLGQTGITALESIKSFYIMATSLKELMNKCKPKPKKK